MHSIPNVDRNPSAVRKHFYLDGIRFSWGRKRVKLNEIPTYIRIRKSKTKISLSFVSLCYVVAPEHSFRWCYTLPQQAFFSGPPELGPKTNRHYSKYFPAFLRETHPFPSTENRPNSTHNLGSTRAQHTHTHTLVSSKRKLLFRSTRPEQRKGEKGSCRGAGIATKLHTRLRRAKGIHGPRVSVTADNNKLGTGKRLPSCSTVVKVMLACTQQAASHRQFCIISEGLPTLSPYPLSAHKTKLITHAQETLRHHLSSGEYLEMLGSTHQSLLPSYRCGARQQHCLSSERWWWEFEMKLGKVHYLSCAYFATTLPLLYIIEGSMILRYSTGRFEKWEKSEEIK